MIQETEEIAKIFRKNPKINLPEDCGIVTATDSALFRHFQLLYFSLKHSHNVKITLYDLGLTPQEEEWASKRVRVKKPRNLIFSRNVNGWQTYSKPLYIQGGSNNTLWLDCDCVVLGSLAPLFDHISKRPLATLCYHWPDAPRNNPELHQIMGSTPVNNPPYINAGVCGFSLERDQQPLLQWEWLLRRASHDDNIKNKIVFWDQGALQWVLEANSLLGDEILHEETWNGPIYLGFDFQEVLQSLKNCPYIIGHAAGRGKNIGGVSVSTRWEL